MKVNTNRWFTVVAGLLLVIGLTSVVSCTWEKRLHRPGYHVEWFSGTNRAEKEKANKEIAKKENEARHEDQAQRSGWNTKPDNYNQSAARQPLLQVPETQEQLDHESTSMVQPDPAEQVSTDRSLAKENDSDNRSASSTALAKDDGRSAGPSKDDTGRPGDHILLMSMLAAALTSFGLIRVFRKQTMVMTRWSRNNPRFAQGLITSLHLALLSLGVMSGYNLSMMGYSLGDSLPLLAGAAMLTGFFSVPSVRAKIPLVLPKTLNRQRLGYVAIALSSAVMASSFGNSLGYEHSDWAIASVVESMDQKIIGTTELDVSDADGRDRAAKLEKKKRKRFRDLSAGGAAILILLLIILLCSGLCLAIGAFVASISVGGAIAMFLLGLLLIYAAIRGFMSVSRRRAETRAKEAEAK